MPAKLSYLRYLKHIQTLTKIQTKKAVPKVPKIVKIVWEKVYTLAFLCSKPNKKCNFHARRYSIWGHLWISIYIPNTYTKKTEGEVPTSSRILRILCGKVDSLRLSRALLNRKWSMHS